MASQPSRGGATTPNAGAAAQFAVWRQQHREQTAQSLLRLWEKPFASSITLLLLTLAILLPSLLYMGVRNVEQWVSYSNNGLEVSAYLQLEASDKELKALAGQVRTWPGVGAVEVVSPSQAAEQISRATGMQAIIDSLPQNPLPPTLQVALHSLDNLQQDASRVTAQLEKEPLVESVSYNVGWFNKAQALVGLGKRLAAGLALLLGLGVVLVVGNTIRLAIERRSEEIRVAKLVGATDGYVRRPFLYMGAWLGLLSSLLAVLLSSGCWLVLTYYIKPLEQAYSTEISLVGLPLGGALCVLLLCTALGWLGAWLICDSHIRSVEPR